MRGPLTFALCLMFMLVSGRTVFAASASLFDDFNSYNTSLWSKANGWSNGDMFNCTWRAANVNFSGGQMELKITSPSQNKFDGGEYRSTNFYHYGLYEVRMKPAKNIGTVSSFFTYTGPTDGKPWDEIDIEFLGKDTTKVQFNYYTNGVGGNEFLYDLGFDASQSFNTYAFDWQPGHIKWYVNGRLVHTATRNIPKNPGKIMMNLWPGIGVDAWLGRYDGKNPLYAYYDWVRYTPGSGNRVVNGEFDSGLNNWYTWVDTGVSASCSVVTNGGLSGTNSARYNITNGGNNASRVQLGQTGVGTISGTRYTLTFRAKASANRSITVAMEQNGGSYTRYMERTFNLTTNAQTFTYTFTPTVTDPNAVLKFLLGGNNNTVWIDAVSITAN